jgi:hypothetical protein
MENIVSHTPDTICKSVRSKKRPQEKCENPATHGQFCGLHYKHPVVWTLQDKHVADVTKLQKWYRLFRGFYMYRRHGPAFWDRTIATNDTDFFSTDPIQDIPGILFLSYKDEQNHVYGFDLRSINSLYTRALQNGETPQNPYTRRDIPSSLDSKRDRIMNILIQRGIQTEWIPIQPQTPEQQWRMKVVDLFHKIDELNYYSSPDWFIGLNHNGQIKFYRELFDIWNYRAGLSAEQKHAIVPHHAQKLFRHMPYSIASQNIATVQKINMNSIRMLITSASDRNDRILGAMYVMTTFTLVNQQARIAYPWLYDSVTFPVPEEDVHPFETMFSLHMLQNLLMDPLPPLQLDPGTSEPQ